MILASVVNRRPSIETTHPGVSRAIPEQTEVSSIPWQRAAKRERGRQKLTRQINRRITGKRREVKLVQVSPVNRKGQPTPIGTTKNRRVHNIDRFVVDSVQLRSREVGGGIGDLGDWAKCTRNCASATHNQVGDVIIDNELRAEIRRNRPKGNIPVIDAQRKPFDPLRTVNYSGTPFIGGLGL